MLMRWKDSLKQCQTSIELSPLKEVDDVNIGLKRCLFVTKTNDSYLPTASNPRLLLHFRCKIDLGARL